MAHRVPSEGSERLAAVFDARPAGGRDALPAGIGPGRPGTWPSAVRHAPPDPPTVPLPVLTAAGSPAGRLGSMLRRLLPGGRVVARVDPGRPGATALALVAAAAAVVAAAGVWMERPRAEPVDTLPAVAVTTQDPPPGGPPAGGPTGRLVVSVVGKVRTPGLVEVPDGARVADVVSAAGGALPGVDLSTVNLARRVADGEQIAVGIAPAPDAVAPGPGGAGAAGGGTAGGVDGPVDLNRATAAQLDALPGIGPVTAAAILEWRTRNGRFSRVEQLREIDGIGERRFGQLRGLVTVS